MSVTEKTYEMLWDCRFCGQKKNLGLSHRHCPGCGAPQDPNARYFPTDAEKVAVEDHPYVGADVHCPACRCPNARNSRCCTNCGSPLTGGQSVALRHDAPTQPAPNVAAAPKKSFPWKFIFIPLVLVTMAFVGCLYVALKTRPGELEVQARSWERTLEVERYELERVTTWCDSVPSGSRVVAKRRAQHGTEKIPDGETCTTKRRDQGNGTFKEVKECSPKYKEKPVYEDQCDYEALRWRTARTERAQGTANEAPRWPDVRLANAGVCQGCERQGKRTESYLLKVREPKTDHTSDCSVPEGTWNGFKVGDRATAEIGAVLGNIDCGSLKKR